MNEQEMQFADPDWKPTGQLPIQQDDAAANVTVSQPVNSSAYNAGQSASASSYEQGYRGSFREEQIPYIPPVARQMPAPPVGAMRRRSRWWVWVIILIILFSMINGMSHSFSGGGPFPFRKSFDPGSGGPAQQTYNYVPQNASQVQVNDQFGSIIVQVGNTGSNGVEVQTDAADSNMVQFVENNGNLAVTVNNPADGNGDIFITLPQNLALNLSTTGSNRIEVDGYTGKLSAKTDSGFIALNGDMLSGQSIINSNAGDINLDKSSLSGQVAISTAGNGNISFTGTLDQKGKYQFTTDSGRIDLNLPADTAMQLQVSRESGSYHSDFPDNAGSPPQAAVTVKSNSGDITINKQ